MMKLTTFLGFTVTLTFLAVTIGCSRALVIKTAVDTDERVTKGDTFHVDGLPAGTVKGVIIENNQRFALLAITDSETTRSKIRKGVVRIKSDQGILLQTEAVAPDAPPLQTGDIVPTQSRAAFTVQKYATRQTAFTVVIGIVAAILLLLLLKAFVRSGILILALILAGGIAWAAQPYAAAAVSRAYSLLPKISDSSAASSVESGADSPSMQSLSELILKRPDPKVVGYAAVFLVSFMGISVVVGACVSKLTRHA